MVRTIERTSEISSDMQLDYPTPQALFVSTHWVGSPT